ncbi:alpha-2-macroglobulin family protein [Segnochrobactraceae bacterium EtOH-i3]
MVRTLRRVAVASLFFVSAGLVPAAAQQDSGGRRVEILERTDLPGFDSLVLRDTTREACESACLADGTCKAFTFNTKANWCFLKSDVGPRTPFPDAVSGRVIGSVAASPTRGPLPLPDMAWLPEDAPRAAALLKAGVAAGARTGRAPDGLSIADTRQLSTGNSAVWTNLSAALLTRPPKDYSEEWRNRETARSLAFAGLTLATTPAEQAAALRALSASLADASLWRPAIEALKESLARAPDAAAKQRLSALVDEHGFRVLDYSVDADTARPRVCIQFSETLAVKSADAQKYVSVAGQSAPTVTVSDQELCVDGLAHGERYDIALRAGLPSVVGEALKTPASWQIYVRDRAPDVRLSGSAYVLPKVGARGIPLVTVNSAGVVVEILHIGARGLPRPVFDGSFRGTLDGWDIERVADESGAVVWSGQMATERVLNTEVTTAFPVDEAIGALKPGVYILSARPVEQAEDSSRRATQWFVVSDLGLATLSANDGLHAFVRGLGDAAPKAGVALKLLSRGNEVLGEAVTDAAGHAVFAPGLTAGSGGLTPTVLTAEAGGDFGFLDLTAAAFDLSDRGVAGRPAPGPLDAFVFTERGIYRAGETVHLTALLRTARSEAVPEVPLTLKVLRPDGLSYVTAATKDSGLGGRSFDVDLVSTALSGTWRVEAYTDPKGPIVGSTTFLVQDFQPERLDLALSTDAVDLSAAKPALVRVQADYLYGAPGRDLALEGDLIVRPVRTRAAFPGFQFGLEDDPVTPIRRPLLDLPRTGADGTSRISLALPRLDPTTRPLEAEALIRVREPGGRAVERSLVLPVATGGPFLGVKPLFSDGRAAEGSPAGFELVAIAADGRRIALPGVRWELVKIERRFQWYGRDGDWSFQPVTSTSRVASGNLTIAADGTARIDAPVTFGAYRLDISVDGKPDTATSLGFTAGWFALSATAETPDVLDVALDKEGYRPGETAELRLAPRFPGKALVTVIGDGVIAMTSVDVPAEGTVVKLPVTDDWTPGAYVTATLYRPTDVAAGRMPNRAVGLAWAGLDKGLSTLPVTLAAPASIRPGSVLEVPITVAGLAPGEEAFVTVAAVDAGILNLTGYKAPDATAYFLGQRRLGAELRDLYGALIDSLTATRGKARVGGDMGAGLVTGAVPTEELVAQYSGLLPVGADGKVTARFEIPAFNGTVRLMAVAWSKDKIGNAEAETIVRDPVVITTSMPRFLAPGDTARLRIDLDNVDGAAGTYGLSLASEGPVNLTGVPATVSLAKGGRTAVEVGLRAGDPGLARLNLTLTPPDGSDAIGRSRSLAVRPASPPVALRGLQALAPNEKLTLAADRMDGFVPGSGLLSVAISPVIGIDPIGLLAGLDRYPFGCAEQLVSRALPLLYAGDLAATLGLAPGPDMTGRIETAITKVLQYQSASGSFGLWSPFGDDPWLTAYVADFLGRARDKGMRVPDTAWRLALDRLRNDLSANASFEAGGGEAVAYGIYVLARAGEASIGDLRYFADDRLADFGSGLAQAQVAAALALSGDRTRAETVFRVAADTLTATLASGDGPRGGADFGTPLRNGAAMLTLAAESGVAASALPPVAKAVQQVLEANAAPTTQEAAWLVMAAEALSHSAGGLALSVDGQMVQAPYFRRLTEDALTQPLEIINRGKTNAFVALTAEGLPERPLPPISAGLTIDRKVYRLDGSLADPATARQNDRFVVVLTLGTGEPRNGRLIAVDLLPAGFEIENPALVRSGDLAAFPWLTADFQPEHVEFRDDRFALAFNETDAMLTGLTVAYMVRAVTPGDFVRPGASLEDMYDPDRIARGPAGHLTVTPAQ